MDRNRKDLGTPTWITGDLALRLVHKIRAEEDAILVGTNTAEKDNPSLTVRHWSGKNPLRAVIDKELRLKPSLNLFDGMAESLIFNSRIEKKDNSNTWKKIDFDKEIISQVLQIFHQQKVLSLIVEGGRQLLESFIDLGLWDEIHVYTGNIFFTGGIRAPQVAGKLAFEEWLDSDHLQIFRNF